MKITRKIFCLVALITTGIFTQNFPTSPHTTNHIYAQALQTMRHNSNIKQAMFASIACFIIDLKFTKEEEIKILELGNIHDSKFKVLDNLYGPGTVWKSFWKTLEPYNLPIFAVGNFRHKDCSLHYFNKISGLCVASLESLKRNKLFQKLVQQKQSHNLSPIKNNKGIIVTRCSGENIQSKRKFKQEYPGFIITNMEVGKYARYKHHMCKLFNSPELKKYRPKFGVYKKEYSKQLTQKIISDLNCDYYVIKPINTFSGNGILMISQKDLDDTLKLILHDYNNNAIHNNFVYNPRIPVTYNYWKHDRNAHFIVEEFVESKHITINNKKYDATMRVIVAPRYDDSNITLHLLGSYWKRPMKSIEEKGTFRERHISKHAPTHEESVGCQVDKHDIDKVESTLKQMMPDLYWSAMLRYYTEYS